MATAAANLKIIIVGAGIGGLVMAILLEKAQIEYEILEKHHCHNPLGSAICLIPSVQPLFQQLGLLDEIKRLSKPFGAMVFREGDMEVIGTYSSQKPLDIKERYGEYCQIIARKDLCALLADQVPRHKIKFGKRVLQIRQNSGEVILDCSDKSIFHCDILVGCDGAYSSVRQCLHKELETKGHLPKQDSIPMGYQYDCLVGVTAPLDPVQIPALSGTFSEFQAILTKDAACSYWCIPLTYNRISWMVVKHHGKDKKFGEKQIFKQSDWGEDVAESMSYGFRELPTAYGCELGFLMDKTPRGNMAKVMLEEKFFKTWYKGRIVLTGDACHKVMPFGGQGANQAIHDVLTLVNYLVELKSNTVPEIEKVFAAYYKARSPTGQSMVEMSRHLGDLMNKKSLINDIIRKVALRWTPRWVMQLANDRASYDRPQAEFLPFVTVGGALQPRPQTPSTFVPGVGKREL
ncbi:hypothetical protein EMPS_09554 [Entomortierella parvispora]|uniref:FAD-binding domain-containing protein n=1 Tax=Entomortierella parvispora TaxID=205924 RepID=A0A9P3HII0_9FUNG|nr:hypothetical protein EMPS_09554 [Entomortierella parvispora]